MARRRRDSARVTVDPQLEFDAELAVDTLWQFLAVRPYPDADHAWAGLINPPRAAASTLPVRDRFRLFIATADEHGAGLFARRLVVRSAHRPALAAVVGPPAQRIIDAA